MYPRQSQLIVYGFSGRFGCILYTGDFRYNSKMLQNPKLKSAIDNQVVQKLYLDNTFAAEQCKFPSRIEALLQVIDLVKSHPDHYIIIGVRNLGKEEVLRAVAKELKETILVSERRLKILKNLNIAKEFTTNPQGMRIQAKEMHLITEKYLFNLKKEKGPVLTILLSALHCVSRSKAKTEQDRMLGIHRVPYSDHSSHQELVEFVAAIRPQEIHPIIRSTRDFDRRHQRLEYEAPDYSRIPESILKFCQAKKNNQTSQSENALVSGVNSARTEDRSTGKNCSQMSNHLLSIGVSVIEIGNLFQAGMNTNVTASGEGKIQSMYGNSLNQESMDFSDTEVGKILGELHVCNDEAMDTTELQNKGEFECIPTPSNSSNEISRDSSSSSISSPQMKVSEGRISDKFKDLLGNGCYDTDQDSFSEAVSNVVLLDENSKDETIFSLPSDGEKCSPVKKKNTNDERDDFAYFELVQNTVFYQDKLTEKLGGKRLSACAITMIANAEVFHDKWKELSGTWK